MVPQNQSSAVLIKDEAGRLMMSKKYLIEKCTTLKKQKIEAPDISIGEVDAMFGDTTITEDTPGNFAGLQIDDNLELKYQSQSFHAIKEVKEPSMVDSLLSKMQMMRSNAP
jgi:hypothetical protein